MADDFLVTQGTGTTIRAVEKSSKKAQVVVLDIGGAGAESLLTTTLPVSPGAAITGPGNPTIDSYTHAAIAAVTGANQVLVSSAANKQIWVYGIEFTTAVAGTVAFQTEDDVAITGAMAFAANGGMAVNPSGNFAMPLWKLPTDKDLEVDVVTATINGSIQYAIVSV
jgi:hypothetical protein